MKQDTIERKPTPEVIVLAVVTLKEALACLLGPRPMPVRIGESTRLT